MASLRIRDLDAKYIQYGLTFTTTTGETGRIVMASTGFEPSGEQVSGTGAMMISSNIGLNTLIVYVVSNSHYGFCYRTSCDFIVDLDSLRDVLWSQNANSGV